MSLSAKRREELEKLCRQFRIDLIDTIYHVQSGHPGGSLSACEIMAVLYTEKMNIDPKEPNKPDRDRLIMSKGHASPVLYRAMAEAGYFPLSEMANLRKIGGILQGHPSMHTPGVDMPSGPLGLGLAAGQGIALGLRADGYDDSYVYVILGDGEVNEGCIWEAAMSASKFKLSNLIAVLDYNKVQLDGTSNEIMPMGNMADKWRSFGWNVIECDGHSVQEFSDAVDAAKAQKEKPNIIIAHTVKGKGVSFMEGKNTYHGKVLTEEEYINAMKELKGE